MTIASDFQEHGYARIEAVVGEADLVAVRSEADRLCRMTPAERSATPEPVRWLEVEQPPRGRQLRGVQNAHLVSATLKGLRNDSRLREILSPLLGEHIKSPLSTLFWKPAHQVETVVGYHQDAAFRKPADKFRNLGTSYVQLGIAIDRHGPENGGMRIVQQSHTQGDLRIKRTDSVLREAPRTDQLSAWGLEGYRELDISLNAGDVFIWSAYLLHGSPANTSSDLNRRFLVSSFMRADDCDVGEVAFEI